MADVLYCKTRVRCKIDLVVLPIFLVTQALQFMDKTALNYANLFGYQQTLGLHGQQVNYLSASEYAELILLRDYECRRRTLT